MDSGFRDDVGVETVAEVDGVDIIAIERMQSAGCAGDGSGSFSRTAIHSPLQITVHDGEKDLKEQVDGVYEDSEQVQPCFAGHGGLSGPHKAR